MDYKWAVNNIKLQRAISESSTKNESDIRALYVKYGGLIKKGCESDDESISLPQVKAQPLEPGVSVVEKIPKKRGRPAKIQ